MGLYCAQVVAHPSIQKVKKKTEGISGFDSLIKGNIICMLN